MSLSIVVARSLNNVIGRGREIPWRVKGEQALFKKLTMGGALLMGRKTFEAIGRPLPGRQTIIITRNPDYQQKDCRVTHSLADAIELAAQLALTAHVVGGGEIYAMALPLATDVHLSTIDVTVTGDVYFPEFPTDDFTLVSATEVESNINYLYQHYQRKTQKD